MWDVFQDRIRFICIVLGVCSFLIMLISIGKNDSYVEIIVFGISLVIFVLVKIMMIMGVMVRIGMVWLVIVYGIIDSFIIWLCMMVVVSVILVSVLMVKFVSVVDSVI